MEIDVTVLPDGNLQIAADEETRRELADALDERGWWDVMHDLLEPYSTNGSFTPFDAGIANPCVGLTDAPCIAESMDVLDDGKNVIVGRLWWYPAYEVRDPLEELRDHGYTTFTFAPASTDARAG